MNRERLKTQVGGAWGNILEWYDFSVYGAFAVVIGQLFFPTDNPVTALLSGFAVFAVGYIMRPLGGAFFGLLGDRVGRKRALILSVGLMTIPTMLVGLLPTYDQIGILAPILLVVLRLIQGLAVGGEFSTSITFLGEQAPRGSAAFS